MKEVKIWVFLLDTNCFKFVAKIAIVKCKRNIATYCYTVKKLSMRKKTKSKKRASFRRTQRILYKVDIR